MKVEINPAIKITVAVGGSEYTMHKPKAGQVRQFEASFDAAKESGKGVNGVVIDFIVSCGLPAEVVDELDYDQLEQVLGVLVASKKK